MLHPVTPIRICVLASGSAGNCTYVATERTAILIDAGMSGREIARRLQSIGVDIASVQAVCVTHEHDDHTASLGALHRKRGVALYANSGTVEALEKLRNVPPLPWKVFSTGVAFTVGDLRIEPFSVPHDSYDPVGFVLSAGETRVGVVTDMGMATGLIRERLRRCHAVVIEANHDEQLLRDAARPWALKQRIAGRQGHLSNSQAAELIAEVVGPELSAVFLAHLSTECNRPELAVRAVRKVLDGAGRADVAVNLTYPDQVSEVVVVTGAGPVAAEHSPLERNA